MYKSKSSDSNIKVGVIGATGYAGQQLIGLLSSHPHVTIKFVGSRSFDGQPFSSVYPTFKGHVDQVCINLDKALKQVETIDCLFLALPHGQANQILKLIDHEVRIIDLSADFRLDDPKIVKQWYDLEVETALLSKAVYGLPELNKSDIRTASIVANPGCYPTAAILSLLPLMKQDYIQKDSIIIDAKSGVTGAGRSINPDLSFAEVNENIKAYGLIHHRHTPEIEGVLSACAKEEICLNFTPHLVPMQRGILATVYVKLKRRVTIEEVEALYESYYWDAPFVRIKDTWPETKHVVRTNYCDIALALNERTQTLIIGSALDNMVKGAAGQAIQNMNIMMGYEEIEGLTTVSYYL